MELPACPTSWPSNAPRPTLPASTYEMIGQAAAAHAACAGAVVLPARAGPRPAADLGLRDAVCQDHGDREFLPRPGHRQGRCHRFRAAEPAGDASGDLGRPGRRDRLRDQPAAGAGRDRRTAEGRRSEGAGHARALPRLRPLAETAARDRRRARPAAPGAGRPCAASAGCVRRPPAAPQGVEVDTDRIAVHAFAHGMRSQPTDRLVSGRVIAPDDFSSFFCTGGTTGTPKIAMRRHANEVANAWSVGQVLGDGIARRQDAFLRPADVPRQRGAGHRAAAVLARRARDPGHAAGLARRRRHRPLLGDGRASPHQLLQRRADGLRGADAAAHRGTRRQLARVRPVRRRTDATGADARLPGEDRAEDPRRLRPDRGHLRQHRQSAAGRAAPRFDRTARAAAGDEGGAARRGRRPTCATARSTKSACWSSAVRMSSPATRSPSTTRVCGSIPAMASAG